MPTAPTITDRVLVRPLHLAGPAAVEGRASLVSTLDELDEWQSWYRDGLRAGFGWLWFVVLGIVVAGPLVAAVRRRGMVRVAALAVLAGVAVFPFMPLTGEFPFRFNIRYLTPTMLLAMPIAAIVAAATASQRLSPTPRTAASSGPSANAVRLNCTSVSGVFHAGRDGTR